MRGSAIAAASRLNPQRREEARGCSCRAQRSRFSVVVPTRLELEKDREVRKTLEGMKLDVAGGSIEEFQALMTREYAAYKVLLEAAGVKPE